MPEENETIRAFVALSLSDEVRAALKQRSIAFQDQFSHMNIKWVPFNNYHLTLNFIGNVQPVELDSMEALVAEAVTDIKPFELTIGEAELFPPDQENKGVLIASVSSCGALLTLQTRLEKVFLAAGYKFIDRPYRPHVTIARLKKNKIAQGELMQNIEAIKTPVDHVHIYEAHKEEGRAVNSIVRSVKI